MSILDDMLRGSEDYNPDSLFSPQPTPTRKPATKRFILPSERQEQRPDDDEMLRKAGQTNYVLPSEREEAERQAQQPTPQSWSDVGSMAISNIPASAGQFAYDIAQPFLHPIQTAENLRDLGLGVLETLGVKSGDAHVQYADAVGRFFADRYGGLDNLKRTIANDPVGFLADASTVLTGGAAAAAKIPATAGRVADVLGTAANITNPLTVPAKTA